MLILFSVVATKASDFPNQFVFKWDKSYFNDISRQREIDNIFYYNKTDFLTKLDDKFLNEHKLHDKKEIPSKFQKLILQELKNILGEKNRNALNAEDIFLKAEDIFEIIKASIAAKRCGKKDETYPFDINDYYEYSIMSPWQSKGIIRKNDDV
jgi:6-pyruvoyl-tetrahydropterin synthase